MVIGHDVWKKKKKMFILMNSGSRMCAGVFEFQFQFQLIKRSADHVVVIVEEEEEEEMILEPIGSLFNQRPPAGPEIASVGGCLVGQELYLFPDEREQNCDVFEWVEDYPPPPIPKRIPPIKFNLVKKTLHVNLPNSPLARKILPLVVAIRDQIFALSLADYCNTKSFREPCFELLDTKSYEWSPLPCSPVHKEFYRLSGHAVLLLDHTSFILVCLKRIHTWQVFFYSYNVQTGKWKTVDIPQQQGLYDCVINKEAVVIGNDIYTYDSRHLGGCLKVFSYTDVSNYAEEEEEQVDLLLGSVRLVEGLEFDRKYPEDYFDNLEDNDYCPCPDSSALAKVEDRILCVLHTLYQDCDRVMHVCVSVIQIEYEGGDRCTTLKSFMCHLHVGRVLSNPIIKSCFVLDPNETSDQSGEASRFAG